jgi:hypothetical protein
MTREAVGELLSAASNGVELGVGPACIELAISGTSAGVVDLPVLDAVDHA